MNEYTSGSQESPSICYLSNDIIVIAWQGEGASDNFGIYASIINASTGENLTAVFRINNHTTGDQKYPSICALSNETFVIAWEGQGASDTLGIYASVFNATTGTNMTSEFRVNSYASGPQNFPSICALSDETFVIAWQGEGASDTLGIFASVFNATTGTNMTSEFRVNNYTGGMQYEPSICALTNESFIISWWGEGVGDDSGSYASVFNATTGTNMTSEFRVNNYIGGWQYGPSICALSNDTCAITWHGSGVDDSQGIFASVFNTTTGTNMTSEFRVNSQISGNQYIPSICALSNETFLIAWYGAGASDDVGIYASVFNATTRTNITSEFRVNKFTSGEQFLPSISALSNETFTIVWQGKEAGVDFDIFFSVFSRGTGDPSPENGDNNSPPIDFGLYLFIFIIIILGLAITFMVGSIYSYKKTKYKSTLNQPPIHKKVIKKKEMQPMEGYTEAEKKEIERTESEVNVEKKKLTCVVHR
ncbi:MAG: hypothetical protein ACFFAT_19890, partial [Promethearchaeota archaeon]